MSLQGPIIVVASTPVPAIVDCLGAAGAFPIVEAQGSEIVQAIVSVRPAAIVLADDVLLADQLVQELLAQAFAPKHGPYIPAVVRTGDDQVPPGSALPVPMDAPPAKLVARLRAALRVRTLHASVQRRAAALRESGITVPDMPAGDPLDDATVLVAGRGRAYPKLAVAVGEQMGLVGALSLDAASNLLKARDVDGLVIGDGFSKRMVETLLAELRLDPRIRDLPVIVVDEIAAIDPEHLPNLDRLPADPEQIMRHLAPMARLHAFTGRLRRMGTSLDAKGIIDPGTGLHSKDAFMRDLERAVADAEDRGGGLSLARFALANLNERRTSMDAARIVGRLTRAADFACRDADGTILVAFPETDLGVAHVVARRIASVLKHTTLSAGHDRGQLAPIVAIAAMRSTDTAQTLIARIAPEVTVAAG